MKNCNIAQNIFMDWYIFTINLHLFAEVNYTEVVLKTFEFWKQSDTEHNLNSLTKGEDYRYSLSWAYFFNRPTWTI